MMDRYVEWYVHGIEARDRAAGLALAGFAVRVEWWPRRRQWQVTYWEEPTS